MTPKIIRNAVSAAITPVTAEPASTALEPSAGSSSRFGAITLNGFRIFRAADLRIVVPHQANEQCFIVRRPDGSEQQVLVEITDEAIQCVERAVDRLRLNKSFWTDQAERFLVDFIWNDGNVPSRGKLTLRSVEREELNRFKQKENDT